MIIATHGIVASQLAGIDPDAQAFFDRVTTAGGTLSATEKTAVNQLVLDMKSYSIWSKMKAIYPMVGASSAACAKNLKSSSFTGSFSSGWTFASTGVTPNGTSAYMNTGFSARTEQTVNNCAVSVYVRTSTMGIDKAEMGSTVSPSFLPIIALQTTSNTIRQQYCWDFSGGLVSITTSDASGFWGVSRTASNIWQSFERDTIVAKTSTQSETLLPLPNIYIGAVNNNGTAINYSFREIAFAHMGDGLTNAEASNFYTAVQAFQTTLSRQV